MIDHVAYVEIALPELAYLVSKNGSPELLNTTAGTASYFERDDVIDAGARIQTARREDLDDSGTWAALEAYFDAAGALVGSSTRAFTIHNTSRPAVTSLYFLSDAATAEINIVDGRTLLALRTDALTELMGRHLQSPSDVTIVGRFTTNEHRYVAISRGVAANSDDGKDWVASNPTAPRDPDEILREFVTS